MTTSNIFTYLPEEDITYSPEDDTGDNLMSLFEQDELELEANDVFTVRINDTATANQFRNLFATTSHLDDFIDTTSVVTTLADRIDALEAFNDTHIDRINRLETDQGHHDGFIINLIERVQTLELQLSTYEREFDALRRTVSG